MALTPYGLPSFALPGWPVITSDVVEDGVLLMAGQQIIIGTGRRSVAHQILNEAIRRNLADVYAWLGWDLPSTSTGRQILDVLAQ